MCVGGQGELLCSATPLNFVCSCLSLPKQILKIKPGSRERARVDRKNLAAKALRGLTELGWSLPVASHVATLGTFASVIEPLFPHL